MELFLVYLGLRLGLISEFDVIKSGVIAERKEIESNTVGQLEVVEPCRGIC